MCDTCRILAERNEELEARVAILEREVFNHDWQSPRELRLTPAEEAMVRAMLKHGERPSSKDFLFDATRYATTSQGCDADPKTIDTMICKLRGKWKAFDLEIETVWARGYRLSPATRTRLTNWTPTTAEAA